MKLTYFLCLGCCKFKNITCWNTSILIISIYFSLNIYIYILYLQIWKSIYSVFFSPVFIFLFYLFCFLLQKSQLFSRWFSCVSLFHLIGYICGRPYHYCAHILGDFTISPFLYPSSLQHALGSQPLCFLFRRLPWAPGDISPVATES